MNDIQKLEKELIENKLSLQGFMFHEFCGNEQDDLFKVESLPDGSAAIVLQGSAPIEERLEQTAFIHRGLRRISCALKLIH